MHLGESELKALMLRALDGDAAAYRAALGCLRERLQRFFAGRLRATPDEVEDLVQETLIAIHTKRATFDRDQLLTAWVYAIARYKLIDHFRRTGRRREAPLDEAVELSAADASVATEAHIDISRGLAGLPPGTRELLTSVKLREEPVAEVAARTGMSEAAVKVAVHRGFRRLTARFRNNAAADRPGGRGQ